MKSSRKEAPLIVRCVPFLFLILLVVLGSACSSELEEQAVADTISAGFSDRGTEAGWPQWGGPDRDFEVPAPADSVLSWGDQGPVELWRRPFGPGEAAVVTDGERLYSSYRDGDHEVMVAMSNDDGSILWQHEEPVELWEGFFSDQGVGPYATPSLVEDRLLAVTAVGTLLCFDRSNGEVLYRIDLWSEWQRDPSNAGPGEVGYTPSPLVWGERVIVVGGGPGRAVQAWNWRTGELAWAAHDFDPAFASPSLIEVGGREVLIVFAADGVHGLDPDNGAEFFMHPHVTDYVVNAAMPVFNGEVLFLSSAYDQGSRGLRLTASTDGIRSEQIWRNQKIQIHHTSAVVSNGLIVGSSGDFGPAFLFALDPTSGTALWRVRGFAKANLVAVGDRVLLLDEDGDLALVRAEAEQLEVLGRKSVFNSRSWSPPTVVGDSVFMRDSSEIVALRFATEKSSVL